MVEFCTGLNVQKDTIILSYSLLNIKSMISVYDRKYISDEIKWMKMDEYENKKMEIEKKI